MPFDQSTFPLPQAAPCGGDDLDSGAGAPPLLDDVLRVLEWARNRKNAQGYKGSPCLTNALDEARHAGIGDISVYMDACHAAFDALPQEAKDEHEDRLIALWRWHDWHAMFEDVIEVLDRAISARRSQLSTGEVGNE